MSSRFGGSVFYDYHRLFSARAAMFMQQHNILLDWSHRDTKLFCSLFAGHRALTCNTCNSPAHSSNFCPLLAQARPLQGPYNSSATNTLVPILPVTMSDKSKDKKGRPRVHYMQREICNDFNEGNCKRNECRFLHVCSKCKQSSHGVTKCN